MPERKDGFTANPGKKSDFKWYHAVAILIACAIAIAIGNYFSR